ncbi:MAG: prolyl-tRNA synthetase associated domain-containing protein [Hyphomicrobiaceae bacterium]
MRFTRSELFDRLNELGIVTKTVDHEAVFTVSESERLHQTLQGGHTKNLFLKDAKGRLFLIVAESHTQIALKTVHKSIGCARLSFGKPELLFDVLGVEPGSVTALSLINDCHRRIAQVIIDDALLAYDVIHCHPLENTATTAIQRDDLLRFLRSCGHEPRIMSFNTQDN